MTLLLFLLAGCVAENSSPSNDDSSNTIEGIKVEGNIVSNNQAIDEAIIEVTITNETNEAFRGTVTVFQDWNYWDIDVDMIVPNTSISRQTKTGYIERDKRSFSYRVKGEFIETYESEISYEILYQPEGTYAFYVQVDEVTEETAISIVKDLYSKYGQNLGRVAIYDSTLDEEIGGGTLVIPKADFYNNMLGYSLTMYNDDGSSVNIEFELP